MFRIELEERLHIPEYWRKLYPIISILSALVFGAIFLIFAGVNPLKAYYGIFRAGFFGGIYSLSDTAVKATPLILAGLGCAIAFRAKLWNVGAEGQLLLGAWAATGVASFWIKSNIPSTLRIVLMAIAGFIAGALWAIIPAILKAKLNVNEIISTLMLVYVAKHWNNYWIYSPWSDRGFQLTPLFPRSAWLPRLTDFANKYRSLSGLTVHLGLLYGIIIAIILWVILKKSSWGFQLKIIGDSIETAKYSGISITKNIIVVMLISGGLAGLAGMTEVAGVVHRLQERFSPGYGFTAIIVAFLAKLHPLSIIIVSFLFGGLLVGAKEVQPSGIPLMLQGIILFTIIGGEVLVKYKPRIKSGTPK